MKEDFLRDSNLEHQISNSKNPWTSTNLEITRRFNGYRQKELSEYIGYSLYSILLYESGEREIPIEAQRKLSEFFGKPIDTEILVWTSTNLRATRKDKGYTQKELGEKIGRSHSIIVAYESGEREIPIEVQRKLSEFLGKPIDTEILVWTSTNLRATRKDKGYTQKELGQNIGCSGAHICRYELGEREIPIEVQRKLSEFLGKPIDTEILVWTSTNLRATRKDKGYTQKELEQNIGCSVGYICKYELGERKISIEVQRKLSEFLGKPIDTEILVWTSTNLQATRKDKGYTQKELAQNIGCSVGYICKCELGERKITIETQRKLSKFLGKPIKEKS